MIKTIIFNDEARAKLKNGIDQLCNVVKVTLGAGGRTVIITRSAGHQLHKPYATKDGVSVARQVELADEMEETGNMMARMASEKTAMDAGDGTTTTVILTQAMVSEGVKALRSGINPIDLKKGMEKAVMQVVAEIKAMAIPITEMSSKELLQVATIAANNDSAIGQIIADTIAKIGKEGVISIGEPKGLETTVAITQGLRIDSGFYPRSQAYFVTHPQTQTCELENPYLLIYENKLAKGEDLFLAGKILDEVRLKNRPILILSDGVGDSVQNSLIQNHQKGILRNCSIQLPAREDARKELLKDIAAATGAVITGFQTGTKIGDIKLEHLGQAEKVVIGRDGTLIFGKEEQRGAVEERVEELRGQLETFGEVGREVIQERIAKLSGGIAVVHVGGATEIEVKERRDRVDDAIRAVQSAMVEGVVVGGGVALLNCHNLVVGGNEGQAVGAKIIMDSLVSPLKQIADNCGKSGEFILSSVVDKQVSGNKNFGYNAMKDTYEDLFAAGIVDAAKVVRSCVENSASVAIQILTSECLLVEKRIKSDTE